MPESLGMLLAFGAVLAAGSALQSAAGFGFAIFTVPLLVVLGCRPEEAITIVAMAAIGNAVVGVIVLRAHVRWRTVFGMVALAAIAMPAGVAVLHALAEQDRSTVRRVLGGIVLLALLVQVTWRIEPRDRLPRGAMIIAMPASGFMGGVSGMMGPAAVIWVMAHRWSNPESRVTLWAYFAGMTPLQLAFLWWAFGDQVPAAALRGSMLIPAVILGMIPGLWIGHRLAKPRLRALSTGILACVGLYALLG